MKIFSVVFLEQSRKVFESHKKACPKLQEVFDGVTWRLERNPRRGGYLIDSSHYGIKISSDVNTPGLLLKYTVDDQTMIVTICGVIVLMPQNMH